MAGHLRFLLVTAALLTLVRLGLMAMLGDRVGSGEAVLYILLGGVRMDLVALSYVLAPAVLLALVLGGRRGTGPLVSRVLWIYFASMQALFLFFEIVTPQFIAEYDSRPNRLFVEYLVHPREISSMLWRGYKEHLALTLLLTALCAAAAWRMYRNVTVPARPTGVPVRLALFAAVSPLLVLGARSSLRHRPANPSSVAFSSDHLLNDLCLSSAYSVAYAVARLKDEADASAVYGSFGTDAELIDEVRRAMLTVPPADFISSEIPTLHKQRPSAKGDRPLNLVILLQESLGAQYVAELGGQPVTRFLDTLSDEGWWFDQMYATGTRSVRGIEAVVAGFLPTPARSTVKLGLSQHGFFTLAELLAGQGYHTQFVYGGESHFDNMKRFFTGNGFDEIVDLDDFEAPVFEGSWGVSDEDIMAKAHEGFLAMGDEPFFSLVFSVSNHSPWEYPAGRIDPFDAEPATVNNTVRYADFALEAFFEAAREAPYWDNTIFVVVADHDSRVHGASLVPVRHFHIPAVILGPGIEARRDARVTSQVDLGPTLLSLMGVSAQHPMIGFDLTCLADDHPGRAIMQYGGNHAYMHGQDVVIHQPGLEPTQYVWDGQSLGPATLDAALERKALAHALIPSLLYSQQRYRLPQAPTAGNSISQARVAR